MAHSGINYYEQLWGIDRFIKMAQVAALAQVNSRRIQQVLVMRAQGRSVDVIATFLGVTRERVKQMLLKGIMRACE